MKAKAAEAITKKKLVVRETEAELGRGGGGIRPDCPVGVSAYAADVVALSGHVKGDIGRSGGDDVANGIVVAAIIVRGFGHLDYVVLVSHKVEHCWQVKHNQYISP
ncbi:hypothetical protein SASPL_118825 [Salvia splendens]|uniref:Uncharacterized protein n=1 Tax=Salvia splendens TaxID=180675 RepID=A0A8X8XYF7_SALSN|nr:hypothetical protein SASPL_118825 [Salvia splendens]